MPGRCASVSVALCTPGASVSPPGSVGLPWSGQAHGSVGHWPLQHKYLYCFGRFTCHFLLTLCKTSDTGWQPSVSWGRRKPSSEGGHFHVAPCSLSFTVSQEPCGSRSVRSVREAVLPLREPQSVVEMTVLRTVCAQRTAVYTSVVQM